MPAWHRDFGVGTQYNEEAKVLEDPIMAYLYTLPKEPIPRENARMLFRLKYQEIYGLVNFDEVERDDQPWPLAALPPLEDMSRHRPSTERIRSFIKDRVAHHTGISLTDFQKLPRHHVEVILEEVRKLNQVEDKQTSNLMNAMEGLKSHSDKKGNATGKLILPNNLRS